MIVILIAAAAVSGITAAYSGEGFADVVIILGVIINAVWRLSGETRPSGQRGASEDRRRQSKYPGGGSTPCAARLVPGD
jgi:Ca2+-transporting ATPase